MKSTPLALLSLLFLGNNCDQGVANPPQNRSGPLPHITKLEGHPVETLLPPDAIPSIDAPRFVSAGEAAFMRDDEPVVGVVLGGVAKAYSTWHLDHHEIVNDTIGGSAVAVTW